MLPMDGNIGEEVPAIFAAFTALVPSGDWSAVSYVDLTAGSCLLPLLFGARGVGRLVINDPAARSMIAARALFGRRTIDVELVRDLATRPVPRVRAHVPTFHFACDYLTEPVCAVFDRLFHADVPDDAAPGLRYLALRWALGFVRSVEDGFEVLLTHAEDQLLAMTDVDWRPYIARSHRPLEVLDDLVRTINTAIAAQRCTDVTLLSDDLATICSQVDYGAHAFVAINPPTNGLDEYLIDDQIVHSLIANRWLPLSQCRESAEEFWRRRVESGLAAVPAGAHCLVWGGDGAMTFDECLAVWQKFGHPVCVKRLDGGTAGWLVLRRE